MAVCRGCGIEHGSSEPWCEVCEVLVPQITGQLTGAIVDTQYVRSVREHLGNPSTRPAQIWSRIRKLPGDEALWAVGPDPIEDWKWITDSPQAWALEEGDFDYITKRHRHPPSTAQLRRLQRGGVLPDGSYLSWNNGRFYLDGIPIKLPYRGLSKIMKRQRGLEGFDWRKLLLSIDLAARRFRNERWEGNDDQGEIIHPAYLFHNRRGNTFAELLYRSRSSRDLFSNQMEALKGTEWMQRCEQWHRDRLHTDSERNGDVNVPVTLPVRGGRLQMRVRRNSGWRRIELDSNPWLWARMVTWALSPPDHEDRRRVNCIQQHLFADEDIPLICGSDLRGVNFLRKVVDSNDRASVDPSERSIRVRGTSGLSYSVTLDRGGHGTRFVVRALTLRGRDLPDPETVHPRLRHRLRSNRLCIVERPELRRLVIGDAIASIVLALLNDLSSQREIDTLRSHISSHRPRQDDSRLLQQVRELEAMDEARYLRDRLENNGLEARVRRCSRSFPRLWSVLLRCPLGERITFTAMRGRRPNVSFDDCETEFTTTSMVDRRVMYAMLEASGWVRDPEEEVVRRTRRVYIRIGTGPRDLGRDIEGICHLMEPELVIGDRVRLLAAPLWTFFERHNPGTSPLLPGTNQLIE